MSHHHHLDRDLLRGIFGGGRNAGDLVSVLLAHLMDLCSYCEEEFEAWKAGATLPAAKTHDEALERLKDRVLPSEVTAERDAARRHLKELLAMPEHQRAEAVQRIPTRYRLPTLAKLLIETSRESMPGHPQEALIYARLARTVLEHCPASMWVSELYARAVAHVANALRATGSVREAGEIFNMARFLLRAQGCGDRLLGAELDCLEGSLRRDQRRFDEAVSVLRRAILTYRLEGLPTDAARGLLTLGSVYHELGRPDKATQVVQEALKAITFEEEPHLSFYARHNLADYLCNASRFDDARAAVAENLDLYSRYGDPLSQLRLAWLEGRIAHGLGELQEAEASLLLARKGFLKSGNAFATALVSLDLAALYLERRETRKVRWLATEMVEFFEDLDIHREALAAAILFRDAVELERVTLTLVEEFARYYSRAQRDPSYAFQDAS